MKNDLEEITRELNIEFLKRVKRQRRRELIFKLLKWLLSVIVTGVIGTAITLFATMLMQSQ